MACWRSSGSLSRSLLSSSRASPIRSSPHPTTPLSLQSSSAAATQSRRLLFSTATPIRTIGVIGCVQSLLPLHSAVAAARLTSHISIASRAFCQLSQGMFPS